MGRAKRDLLDVQIMINATVVGTLNGEVDQVMVILAPFLEKVLGTNDIVPIKLNFSGVEDLRICDALRAECIADPHEVARSYISRDDDDSGTVIRPSYQLLTHRETDRRIVWSDSVPVALVRREDHLTIAGILNRIASNCLEPDPPAPVSRVSEWTDTTSMLLDDVKFFLSHKQWFEKRGLEHSRGYLLYGPPGNGKTTAVRAIAREFNLRCESYDMTQGNDKDFQKWLSSRGFGDEPTIKLLEDIDRFFVKDSETKIGISLSALLNGLDGVSGRDGTIVIATANHPERLDEKVITRPGRFDLRIPFDPPTSVQALKYLTRIFRHDPNVSTQTLETAVERLRGHSFAMHESILAVAGAQASRAHREDITNADVERAIDVVLTSVG